MQNSNLDLIAHTSEEHKHCHLKNKFKGEQTDRVGLRLGWAFLKVAFSRKEEGDQFDSSLSLSLSLHISRKTNPISI